MFGHNAIICDAFISQDPFWMTFPCANANMCSWCLGYVEYSVRIFLNMGLNFYDFLFFALHKLAKGTILNRPIDKGCKKENERFASPEVSDGNSCRS